MRHFVYGARRSMSCEKRNIHTYVREGEREIDCDEEVQLYSVCYVCFCVYMMACMRARY